MWFLECRCNRFHHRTVRVLRYGKRKPYMSLSWLCDQIWCHLGCWTLLQDWPSTWSTNSRQQFKVCVVPYDLAECWRYPSRLQSAFKMRITLDPVCLSVAYVFTCSNSMDLNTYRAPSVSSLSTSHMVSQRLHFLMTLANQPSVPQTMDINIQNKASTLDSYNLQRRGL